MHTLHGPIIRTFALNIVFSSGISTASIYVETKVHHCCHLATKAHIKTTTQ